MHWGVIPLRFLGGTTLATRSSAFVEGTSQASPRKLPPHPPSRRAPRGMMLPSYWFRSLRVWVSGNSLFLFRKIISRKATWRAGGSAGGRG